MPVGSRSFNRRFLILLAIAASAAAVAAGGIFFGLSGRHLQPTPRNLIIVAPTQSDIV